MKEKDSDEMFQSMIEKIKKESIVYDDFLGRDLCLIVETHEELINSICGRCANIQFYLWKIGKEDTLKSQELQNKSHLFHDLKRELAMNLYGIGFQKQAIQYLSKESKEIHKEWKIYYDLYAKLES